MDESELVYITLIRHGRSQADDEDVHEGRYDSPLTEVGRAQALARALEFQRQKREFDLIISSPLHRARSTAQIIAGVLGVPMALDEDWMERDNGVLAGMRRDVAAAKYPKPKFRGPYEPMGGTGESAWTLYCRAARAIGKVIQRGAGSYLVVAHGGIMNAALRTIIGTSPRNDKAEVEFVFGDLGYMQLEYRSKQHVWRLLEFVKGYPVIS